MEPTTSKDLIFHLGGRVGRILGTWVLANRYPTAKVLISTEYDPQYCYDFLVSGGIDPSRIEFDYQGWDTVSQFVKCWPKLRDYDRVFIVTDHYHCYRSLLIAQLCAWKRDRAPKFMAIPTMSGLEEDLTRVESARLVYGDAFYALLWNVTGYHYRKEGLRRKRWPEISILASQVPKAPEPLGEPTLQEAVNA